jgi:glutathione S-transferase
MITLYGFGPGFGLPEISPFVTKTEVQLKMAGLTYRKEKARPPASPKGQLPYIVDEAESIADSTFIRAHIEGKYGFDFDAPLSLQDRAQAWAFERMIEHTMSIGRWSERAGWRLKTLQKGPRIFSMRRPSICVKSSAKTRNSVSPRTTC